jgi:excinuclease UvrABC nuclease subunit
MEAFIGTMNRQFLSYVNKLPKLIKKLKKSELINRTNLSHVPKKGVYVFYSDGRPAYVGRSNDMKARIQKHSRPSSGHNSATFAFLLAKEKADELGINTKMERKVLEKELSFQPLYYEAKIKVSNMPVRVVDIDDQVLQALFEVYASLELKTTKYNDFSTH